MDSCINEFIDRHKEDIFEDVKSLIEIPSISLNKKEVDEALQWVIRKGEAFGLETKTLLDNKIGVIELGEGEETVGILTHVDVVGVEDLALWKTEPFKAECIDDCIYGRGAVDDKGPLVACLYAMKAIKESGKLIHKKVQMIIGTQEETEWSDIEAYVKSYKIPDYAFTPDGEFPITNIEKGYLDVSVKFKKMKEENNDQCVKVVSIGGGNTINVIPAKCEAVLRGDKDLIEKIVINYNLARNKELITLVDVGEDVVVTAMGLAAHSCFPEKGLNAIVILSDFLKELPLNNDEKKNLVEFISDVFTDNGDLSAFGLKQHSEYKDGEYVHKTVASPTILQSDEKGTSVLLNFRTAYGTLIEDIRICFENFKQQYRYDFEFMEPMEATYVSKECKFLHALAGSYEKVSGLQNEFLLAHGASYAKAMPKTVAFGPIFPGEEDCCHEANEFISKENLIKITKIYANALENMVYSKESFK